LKRVGDQSISGGTRPAESFPCKGGGPNDYVYVYTSRTNPEHWKRLMQVTARRVGDDPRFGSPALRAQREERSTPSSVPGPEARQAHGHEVAR